MAESHFKPPWQGFHNDAMPHRRANFQPNLTGRQGRETHLRVALSISSDAQLEKLTLGFGN